MGDPNASAAVLKVGSHEYFAKMPANQARQELEILFGNYYELERKYQTLRAGLSAFKSLLDETAEL